MGEGKRFLKKKTVQLKRLFRINKLSIITVTYLQTFEFHSTPACYFAKFDDRASTLRRSSRLRCMRGTLSVYCPVALPFNVPSQMFVTVAGVLLLIPRSLHHSDSMGFLPRLTSATTHELSPFAILLPHTSQLNNSEHSQYTKCFPGGFGRLVQRDQLLVQQGLFHDRRHVAYVRRNNHGRLSQ